MRKRAAPKKTPGPFAPFADYLVLVGGAPVDVWILDDGTPISGFYQSFGILARTPREAESIARDAIASEHARVLRVESVRPVDKSIFDPRILRKPANLKKPFWYRSGRVLFQDAITVEPES
ncbi:MAG: hypothetical protein AAB215_09295 [Planctomycetota bacterium]